MAEAGVRVHPRQLDAVGLGNLLDLILNAQDGHALFVGFRQSSFELLMGCDQALGGETERSS